MPQPTSTNELLEITQRSGVVDETRLNTYLQQLAAQNLMPKEPSKLAGLMVRDGLLTLFQAEQLLMGKWKRFSIGKYKVLEKLGSGGMGQVFLCEHKMMRRRVAVKVLPTAKADDPSSLERFYREARVVAALDHLNIVRAYDIDQDDNLHFLVMEFVDGPNLQDVIKKHGPMDPLRACHYIRQAAVGLQHAFDAAGIIHRDIKPGNVLIDRQGVVKILDMGLARFFHDEEDLLTKQYDETVLGTADYLAPEQAIDSHNVDIRADVYSLGATFYFMLTGQPPFPDGTVAQKLVWHGTKEPTPICTVRPEVPAAVAAVVEKMMAKDKNARYQRPIEVAQALVPLTMTPIGPPPETEMLRWSPAAMGAPPAIASGPPPRISPTPASPPTAPRSVPPAAPPAPAAPLAVPSAAPRTPGPRSATPKAPAAFAAPSPPPPAAAPTTQSLARPTAQTAEAAPIWAAIAAETPRPASAMSSTQKNRALSKVSAASYRVTTAGRTGPHRKGWLLFAAVGVLIGALTVIALIALGALSSKHDQRDPGANQSPPAPPVQRLIVDTSAAPEANSVPMIARALAKARAGDRVIVRGPVVEEEWANVAANHFPAGVTIEAENPPMIWRLPAAARDTKAVFIAANMDGLKFKGFVFDGQGRAENGIYMHSRCPGVTFEDCAVQNCKEAAVKLSNVAGDEGRPIRFLRTRLTGTPTTKAVIYLYAAPNLASIKENRHVVFDNCQVEGPANVLALVEGSAEAISFSRDTFANGTSGLIFRPIKDTHWVHITVQGDTFSRIGADALLMDTVGATVDGKSFTIRDSQFAGCKNVFTVIGSPPPLTKDGNVRDAASGEGNGGLGAKVGEIKLPADLPISK